jgi:hypothetical protein
VSDPMFDPNIGIPMGALLPPTGGLHVLPGCVVDKVLAIGLEGIIPAIDQLLRKYPQGCNVYPVFAGMLPYNVQQKKLVMTPTDGKGPNVAMLPCFLFVSVAQGQVSDYVQPAPRPEPMTAELPATPTSPAVPKGMRLVLPEEAQR